MKAKATQHFAPSKNCDAQGSAVEILDHPFSLPRNSQQSRPQCSADMGPPLTPIQAGAREPAAQLPGRLDVNVKSLKRSRTFRTHVVRVVAAVRTG
jgi:hypothetical protein